MNDPGVNESRRLCGVTAAVIRLCSAPNDSFGLLFQQYADQSRHIDALNAWRNATMLKPDHSLAWNNMVILLDNTGTTARTCWETTRLLSGSAVFILSLRYKGHSTWIPPSPLKACLHLKLLLFRVRLVPALTAKKHSIVILERQEI